MSVKLKSDSFAPEGIILERVAAILIILKLLMLFSINKIFMLHQITIKSLAILILYCLLFSSCSNPYNKITSSALPVSHHLFDSLLQKHVDKDGWVNYEGIIQDSVLLNDYLIHLSKNPPDTATWTKQEEMTYWINAYNSFTLKLVIMHFPIQSIKDIGSKISIPFINSVWDIKFIKIGDHELDLNNIEHDILREKFNDPRIHFAINCASISCPKLLNKAYFASTIDKTLSERSKNFINDMNKNIITSKNVEVSKLFLWYGDDFTKKGSLIDYLNEYSKIKIEKDAKISYKEYDWKLNKNSNSDI